MESQMNVMLHQELKECCQKLIQALELYENHPDRMCLKEIQSVIKREISDFEAIDEIIDIMEEYGWNVGTRHDFG